MTAPSSYLVAQLGARMNYAVPRILHSAGQLSRLFTDLCATRGLLRWLRVFPMRLQPSPLKRMLARAPKDLPPDLVRAFTRLGISYALHFARTRTQLERVRLFLSVNERFGRWVVGQDWGGAGAAFVYNTAGVEILTEARRRGLRAVMEQTIAPFAVERRLLAEERNRFPAWETDPATGPEFDAYAERERVEWSLADRVVCGSPFVRDGLMECGVAADRCRVVPYGVDAAYEVPRREPHQGPLRVLTVGAVGLRKGTPYAIAVAKRLKGKSIFRWVGPLKLADTARAEIGDDIEFTGSVTRAEVVRHYAWADVFFLPSLCEGSATASYEALTAGLPVVCTPNTGSVIRDGVEGYIVPERNVDAMAARLETLAGDRDLCRAQGMAARQRAAEMNYDRYARNLLAALDGSA